MFSCNKDSFNNCNKGGGGSTGPTGPPYDGSGNLDLSCNAIIDVSSIDFCQHIVCTVSPNLTGNIAIGNNAGYSSINTIAIGHDSGRIGQNGETIAIGREAGEVNQGKFAIAIGRLAGNDNQDPEAIAIGTSAGLNNQQQDAIAIGLNAGQTKQSRDAVAIGEKAGNLNQGDDAVAIGEQSGQTDQGSNSIAIGPQAGQFNQGIECIAIGKFAGQTDQSDNTIVLNATGLPLETEDIKRFYVKPIRKKLTTEGLYYNATTGEITYETAGGGGGGSAWDPSFNYYFMRKPWSPVYITDGSFTPPLIYDRGTFDASSGKYDPVDQRIELNWILPPREAAAFNFNAIPHQLNDGTVNLTNSGAPNSYQDINDICLNYLPYHETLHIDIRKFFPSTGSISQWTDLADIGSPPNDGLGLAGTPEPNLYAQTRGAYFSPGTGTVLGIYGPVPPATGLDIPKFIYQNTNSLQLGSAQFQFRIYLKNKSEEVLPSPDYWGQVNPEWNYLYMPDVSDSFFVFGSFGPATPPQLINLSSTNYKLLNISGANNFPNSSSPYADQSLNTPFPSLNLYNLHVNYGFDLSGSISSTSLQFQIPPVPFQVFDISYVSDNITLNNWLFGNNFTPSPSQNLTSTGNEIIFPGYQYDVSGYFMKINSDLSYNVYTTNYPTPTPYPSVIVPPPTRNQVTTTNIYDNFLSGNFFVNSNLIKVAGTDASLATVAYYTGVLTPPLSNVYFFGPTSEYRLNNNGLNYKVADARTSLVGEYPNDLGTALVGQDLCFFQFSTDATLPQDLSGTMRIGYTGNDSATSESNSYFEFDQSESRDAITAQSITTVESYRLRGWYLGVEISSLLVKNITLTSYPDICNNTFAGWDISFGQYFANGTAASPPLNYDLFIAKHPLTDIVLNGFSQVNTNPTTTTNFFGLNRPSTNPVFISTLAGQFTDMNIWWRPSNILMTGELKYALSNSGGSGNLIDNYSIPWPYNPQPAFYNISLAPNQPTIVELALTTITTIYKYSRDRNFIPQFYIDGTHSNNITYPTPITPSPSILDISFNNQQLWWDFTTLNPTLPFSYTLHVPGIGQYPTNYSPGYISAYSHSNQITDSQLMWCKTGFTAGNYTTNTAENPYIDYTIYYDQTIDYSSKNTTGISKSLTYTAANDDYYAAGNKTITGTYKWILLSDTRVSSSSFGRVVVNGSGGTANPLKLGDDYLLYIQEIEQFFDPVNNTIPSGYAAGRSGWKAVQGTWDQGATVQLNNADEAGAYRRNTNSGAVAVNYIKFYSPNANTTIFYRIGIKNSSNIKISNVTISYGTN